MEGQMGWWEMAAVQTCGAGLQNSAHDYPTPPCHAYYYLSSITFAVSNSQAFASCFLLDLIFSSTASTNYTPAHNGPRAQVRWPCMAKVLPECPHH